MIFLVRIYNDAAPTVLSIQGVFARQCFGQYVESISTLKLNISRAAQSK